MPVLSLLVGEFPGVIAAAPVTTTRVIIGRNNGFIFEDNPGTILKRISFGETETIQQNINQHMNQRAPRDAFTILEFLEIEAHTYESTFVDTLLTEFEDFYGEVFHLRSEIHNRVYVGFVDDFGRRYNQTCEDIMFRFIAKESFSI